MNSLPNLSFLPFLALYAETHFRFFQSFPSYLYSRQPEVIFDAPRRLAPGQDLPVVLIVNDVHRFPAELGECAIAVSQANSPAVRFDFPDLIKAEILHPLRKSMRAFLFTLPRSRLNAGLIYLTCRVNLIRKGRPIVVVNDNLRTTGKRSYSCFVADDPLPGSEFCSYGDCHLHSHYSQSHVEFGTPLQVIARMAEANGLSFAAITDHSYDLACSMDDFLQPDPKVERWQSFQQELAEVARSKANRVLLIPGEEVSCLNARGEVVHLLGLNLREYVTGTLDGARKGRGRNPQLTLAQAIEAIHRQNGLASAAHPGVHVSLLQKLFLQRGNWANIDMGQKFDAVQIVNSGFSRSWYRGKTMWLKMLQQRRNIPLLAGNDAHGDFNRYRAIKVPFIAVQENANRYMGFGKTGIYGKATSVSDLISYIGNGSTFVTTGPFATLSATTSPKDSVIGNQNTPLSHEIKVLYVHAISTPEFGALARVEVISGERENEGEKIIFSRNYTGPAYKVCEPIDRMTLPKTTSYVRIEVTCISSKFTESKAYSSALFLS